jgi:hypothetical protein
MLAPSQKRFVSLTCVVRTVVADDPTPLADRGEQVNVS